MRTLLIDGDVFAFQAAAGSERIIHWNEHISTLEGHPNEAIAKVDEHLQETLEALEADAMVICLSDASTDYWRRQVLPTYKHTRVTKRKPIVLVPVREHLLRNYDCRLRPTLEGDDCLGILSTHPTLILGEKVIVSIDKDMNTIPGKFCRNLHGSIEIVDISEEQADYYHLYQTLIGDTTDGYTGCPGIGPVSAKKILDGCAPEGRWQAVVKAYEKQGLNETSALIQARVARILRYRDYDYKRKTPILWRPPNPVPPVAVSTAIVGTIAGGVSKKKPSKASSSSKTLSSSHTTPSSKCSPSSSSEPTKTSSASSKCASSSTSADTSSRTAEKTS